MKSQHGYEQENPNFVFVRSTHGGRLSSLTLSSGLHMRTKRGENQMETSILNAEILAIAGVITAKTTDPSCWQTGIGV